MNNIHHLHKITRKHVYETFSPSLTSFTNEIVNGALDESAEKGGYFTIKSPVGLGPLSF